MLQATEFDGFAFGPFSFQQDGVTAPKVDISRGEVAETFVISATIVMIDEGCDLCLKVLREVIVFQQDAVLERLVPPLDLALGLGMARLAVHLFDGSLFEPIAKVGSDVARAIVG